MRNAAKIGLCAMFLNYYCIYIIRGSMLPYITYVAYILMGLYILQSGKLEIGEEVKMWIIYIILSLATVFFAQNSGYAISGIIKFAERLLITITIIKICKEEQSIKFPISLLTCIAVSCALSVITNLSSLHGRLNLETGANVSVNDVGSIMAYGCFSVLLFCERAFTNKEFFKVFLKASLSIVLIIVLFLAGSRKAFYAVLILYTLLILTGTLEIKSPSKFLAITVVAVGVYIFADRYLLPLIGETSLYSRLWGTKAAETVASDESRFDLYYLAIKDFMNHPIWGLGFNNFDYVHGNYTHSTYAEPIACSGLIGLFYLVPYARMFKNQRNLIRYTDKGTNENLLHRQMYSFYIMFLFIGFGIPYIYKDVPCIILGMIIAYQYLSENTMYEEGYFYGTETS